jgi:hypothetical protein
MKSLIQQIQIRDIQFSSLKMGTIRCLERSVTNCEQAQREITEKWQHQMKSIFHITEKINYVYESCNVGLRKEYFSLSPFLVLHAEIAINFNTVSHEKTSFIIRYNIL